MMIDKKTKKKTLVSRKKFRDTKNKVKSILHDIEMMKSKIKVLRPILLAYVMGNAEGMKQYDSYDKWLVEEFLQGKDEEHSSYHLYANMMIEGLRKEVNEEWYKV